MKEKWLSELLKKMRAEKKAGRELSESDEEEEKTVVKELQLKILRIQEGVFYAKKRVIIAFEGFDAAGKGGTIRRLTEKLDPRSFHVHPIGPPDSAEQGKHWLYRFWTRLPEPGSIAVFDRTWYGRVLVERVDKLISEEARKRAYDEINQFEAMLVNDGIDVVKVFLAITKEEQRKRFEDRLKDPYKQWKLTESDLKARSEWSAYVKAADDLLSRTHTKLCPWHVIAADNKPHTHREVLALIDHRLIHHRKWMESRAEKILDHGVKKALKALANE